MRMDCPCLLYAHTTHNNHTTASIDSGINPRKHICFKPSLLASITLPNLLTIQVPSLLEESGCLSAPSVATAASTLSLTTSGDAKVEDDFTMLARLQGIPIHTPPGPCPPPNGVCFPTRTQIQADQKAEKDAKAKAAEEKRLAAAAFRIKTKAKRQEKLIFSPEAKATKAAVCAEELQMKLAEAIRASTDSVASALLHKKSKGVDGLLTVSPAVLLHSYLSPQRRAATANKRVTVQLPKSFPAGASLLRGSESDSCSAGVLTLGEDTSNDKQRRGRATNEACRSYQGKYRQCGLCTLAQEKQGN
jgi:hypothetical protein